MKTTIPRKPRCPRIIPCAAILLALLETAPAQQQGWQRAGSFYILTTPEGTDLPATASEEGCPLLVRLTKETFDFSQAKANGEDIRFAAGGKALAYQIEEWDAAKGVAAIWVRIPVIKGNARQEIKMHWGKPDASSESNGTAVFNASNGYLSVMHLGDPANSAKDDVGVLAPVDAGTTAVAGIIGQARHFSPGKGINCGENITTFPTGAGDHTSEVWLKADAPNAIALAWGNEHGQGKMTLRVASPPHVGIECYFSGADVAGQGTLPMKQWVQVVHTYRNGESRVYVNGRPDGESITPNAPLAIKSPARMYVGGWYGNYQFTGDLDEVRISKVVRSANWVRMQYENQKPLQTLVGSLVQPGNAFAVSVPSIKIDEGRSVTVQAKAGGAQKVYWILKRDGAESVVGTDQYTYTFDAGRVVADTACLLQFKAVYANEVKTKDIPVTVKETIPEPVATLNAPANWNGRDIIEVVPVLANLPAMKAKGAADLHYQWSVTGGSVIKEVTPDKLILKRSQFTGPLTVKVAIDNGGTPTLASCGIVVTEPKTDPWVGRTPAKDEKPEDGQFYARDDKNEGALYYNGTLDQPASLVFLKLYADGKLIETGLAKPAADKSYALRQKLMPGLIKYKVEFGIMNGTTEKVLQTVDNLVCGDAWLIDGQSNALATDTGDKSPPDTSEWIRSYGRPGGQENGPRQNLWCLPVWKAEKGEKAELGWWGMELAKRLVKSTHMPVFIINAAVGGTRIDQHIRNEANPTDLNTIYGRMLWRVQQARLTHGIRGVIWHQGESDQGSDGPAGGYGWESYQQYFLDLSASWKQDMPNIRHYYVYQIWPNSCSMGNSHGDMLREVLRTLPRQFSNMDIMSTLGIKPAGPCHYPLSGWSEFARLVEPLIERDFYGVKPAGPITPPDLKRAYLTNTAKDAIALEFDQPVIWQDALADQFYLDGAAGKVASGAVAGNVVTLKLKERSTAKKITYLKEMSWSQDKLVWGANGIAALTFCDVPVAQSVR